MQWVPPSLAAGKSRPPCRRPQRALDSRRGPQASCPRPAWTNTPSRASQGQGRGSPVPGWGSVPDPLHRVPRAGREEAGAEDPRAHLPNGPQVVHAPAPPTPPPSFLPPAPWHTIPHWTRCATSLPWPMLVRVLLPAPGMLSHPSASQTCPFYTLSSNAPSSIKPSLTVPQASKAGAAGLPGSEAGVPQPCLRGSV